MKSISFYFVFLVLPVLLTAQKDTSISPAALKKLSLEELLNVEVTLVSRTPQKINEAASAIQVISGADILRSGALNLPDALRLVTNLQVGQLNASAWIISSRGFNTIFANKLLVMIDGRTVYTPLFGGVIWELQNVLMEDIDRIEVVSGPGATLWGANAVNGVINIVTKKTTETQGAYLTATAGTFIRDFEAVRYGGKIGKDFTYKVYAQHYDRNPTILPDGKDNSDAWKISRTGFRMDWPVGKSDAYIIQGDFYAGARKTVGGNSNFDGQNVLGRWKHTISERSDINLQVYFDRYYRNDIPSGSSDKLTTYDVDFQYRFPIKKLQSIIWGLGYRSVNDRVENRSPFAGILPAKKNLDLVNTFIQDEISLHDRLKLTVGTKLLHNVYTGYELQPSARLAWAVTESNTLWTAVSRAVRTPSRFDVDYFLPVNRQPPNVPSVAGGPNFVSEKMIAWELGYRVQPGDRSALSFATFYNVYRDVYSVETLPGTQTYQIQNGSQGKSWGLEFSGTFQVSDKWRLRSGYTYFDKKLKAKPGHNFDPTYLGNDAKHQAMLQSILDLPLNFQFDIVARYLDHLGETIATPAVPSYATFDARLAWHFKRLEISVVGQNLTRANHVEFGSLEVPRSMYARVTCRF